MIEGRQVQIATFDLQSTIDIMNTKLTSICFTNLCYRSEIINHFDHECKQIIEIKKSLYGYLIRNLKS